MKRKKTHKNLAIISRRIRTFEKKLIPNGCTLVAGVDEVGRGSIAGPVVAAAVIFPIKSRTISGVFDSKHLTQIEREKLSPRIIKNAISVGIGIIDNTIIDQVNIYHATIKAMRKALESLKVKPELVLVDAMKIPDLDFPQKSIIKGDEKCYSIAAASIVAKVFRDSLMKDFHKMYPHYDFKSNKGYYCRKHVNAIKEKGVCELHRLSFPVIKRICDSTSKF